MEKNPYEKNKYLEKHRYLNVSQAELERKWRLYEEEQELMKLMMGISAPGNAYSVPFISTWKTDNLSTGSSNSNQVKLPLIPDGSYNFYVNWGDGTFSSIAAWNQPEVTHTYPAIGTYTISITGYIRGWDWGTGTGVTTPTTGDRLKILTITQWGCLRFVDKGESPLVWGAFYNCTNLTLLTVVDTPNFEGTTSTLGMFRGCSAITTINNINKWDVSGIKYFRSMFREMPLFNDNIGNWNMSSATNLIAMFFAGATSTGVFNNGGSDSIKNWNTSNVLSLDSTFRNQTAFNQEIGLWDISKVTTLVSLLITPATTPAGLGVFNNAGSPSINNWNTSSVTSMNGSFCGQRFFNQPVGNWNTSNVTNMNLLFYGSNVSGYPGSFNQDISNWNTSNVTIMTQMLQHQPNFNQNIGNWNVSNVTNFSFMFYTLSASPGSFNNGGSSSINNWNTALATTMANMFQNQTGFNQPIGNWNVSLVTAFTNFMTGKTNLDYSTANYDALLIGWASRSVKPSISINFGTIKYTAAATAARAILTSAPNNWTIVDGGL
jgi:surface protein